MEPLQKDWKELYSIIHPSIIDTITEDLKLSNVMPVQDTVIPLFSKNTDVVVESCTGSGKTLAFLIPTLNRLVLQGTDTAFVKIDTKLGNSEPELDTEISTSTNFDYPNALIVSPTRELAQQIHQVLQSMVLGIKKRLNAVIKTRVLIGGKSIAEKVLPGDKDLKCLGVVWVGTPGRLREVIHTQDINGKYYTYIYIRIYIL